jgi:hypothetical protein
LSKKLSVVIIFTKNKPEEGKKMKTVYVWLLVSWKTLIGKIPVEKLEALLGSDVSTPEVTVIKKDEVIAIYPDFVDKHLTPNLERGNSRGVKKYSLKCHLSQTAGKIISGHAIYAWLIETNQLFLCIELADLQWWEQHPDEIPKEFIGKLVYAWGSVVLNDNGYRYVPCLSCNGDKPYVLWCSLGSDWRDFEPACLRAS